MAGATLSERVAAAWRDAVDDAAAIPSARAANARPLAIGWATVELDRATRELARALGIRGDQAFRAAPRSVALGGACRIAPGVLPDGGSLVVIEPDTEGRLAGSLARLGEGPVAVWIAAEAPATALDDLRERGFTLAVEQGGPLGGERLIVAGPGSLPGRHRLLVVRPAGTIRP